MSKERIDQQGSPLRRKRLGIAAKATAFVTLGSAAVLSACGGGGSADNPTETGSGIEPSPSNTLVVTSTPGSTPEVTEIPKPSETPINFSVWKESVLNAYSISGIEIYEDVRQKIDHCGEQNLPPDALFPTFVLYACSVVGEDLKNQFAQTGNPLFVEVLSETEKMHNQAIDEAVSEGILRPEQGASDKENAKLLYFTVK